jgi:hypothetical protein
MIEPQDVPWHLWSTSLQGPVPKPGDQIEDADGVKFRILTATFSKRTSRYRCTTRREQ